MHVLECITTTEWGQISALSGFEVSNVKPKYYSRDKDGTNPSKPSGHYMYRQVWHSKLLPLVHTVYLCVLYGSQNKHRLFPCTALTGWFLQSRQSVLTAPYVCNLKRVKKAIEGRLLSRIEHFVLEGRKQAVTAQRRSFRGLFEP